MGLCQSLQNDLPADSRHVYLNVKDEKEFKKLVKKLDSVAAYEAGKRITCEEGLCAHRRSTDLTVFSFEVDDDIEAREFRARTAWIGEKESLDAVIKHRRVGKI